MHTPEGVSIWLAAMDAFPAAKSPPHVWKHGDPLDAHERSTLAKIMKESSVPDDARKDSTMAVQSIWNSKLHFAWDAILTRIYHVKSVQNKSKNKPSKSSRLSFLDFWVEVVDGEYLWFT
jgi:DNA polymerase phi